MSKNTRGEAIPLTTVMPYVEEFVLGWYGAKVSGDEHPYVTRESILADHPDWGNAQGGVPVLLLAERAKVKPNTLNRWRREGGEIGFFDADALLTAMGRMDLWQSDPVLASLRDEIESRTPCLETSSAMVSETSEGTTT